MNSWSSWLSVPTATSWFESSRLAPAASSTSACVLAQGPSVVLLDEPSSGIAQREAEALGPLLRQVRDETGCALVVIEHDMPLLLGLAERLYALEVGTVVDTGAPHRRREPP